MFTLSERKTPASCSSGRYTVENGAIRISLRQLNGMSEEATNSILAAREEREFVSLRDFIMRTKVSRLISENLIKVGAFDTIGDRNKLIQELSRIIDLNHRVDKGVKPLFEVVKTEPAVIIHGDRKVNMIAERELLSLDLSSHPLDFLSLSDGFTYMRDLPLIATGRMVTIAGSVIRYQTPPTRNGNRVVYVIMEDGTGIADVTIFSNVQQKCGNVLFKEAWLIVTGKVQRRGPKSLSIIAEKLSDLRSTCDLPVVSR